MPDTSVASLPADLYERLLPFVRANYDAHDKACPSLRYFWLGRRGGVSAAGDQRDCDGCQHTFHLDGLAWINWRTADVDDDEVHLCGCCAVAAGHQVAHGAFGITVVE